MRSNAHYVPVSTVILLNCLGEHPTVVVNERQKWWPSEKQREDAISLIDKVLCTKSVFAFSIGLLCKQYPTVKPVVDLKRLERRDEDI